ncbi:MAG: DUF932 domain-containing protein [bacterium]|nr:DUF932 domain-containing protein [bacterium]
MIQFDTPKELRVKEKELYKPIKKILLADILPKRSFPTGNEFAIVDNDGNILNFCSDIYFPKLNSEIFPQIEKGLLEANIEFRKKIVIIGPAKFYVDYIIMTKMQTLSVNDVFPRMQIMNSYDGKMKFRKEFGFYKLLCSNGLCRPTEKKSSVSFKHTKDNEDNINRIISITKDFIQDSKNDMRVFEQMNSRNASTKTIEKIAEKLSISKHITQAAVDRYTLETESKIQYLNEHNEQIISNGVPKTMFAVYNALNWAMANCNLKELPEKKLEKDRQILEMVESF